MIQADREALKVLCQSGGLRVIEAVCEEIKSQERPPEMQDNEAKTMYELGKYWGKMETLNNIIEEIKSQVQE